MFTVTPSIQGAVRAAVQTFAKRTPGAAASEAQVVVADILARVDTLTTSGQPVPSQEGDELRASIERAIDLIVPVDGWSDERRANAEAKIWLEETFRLLVAHLDI